MESHDSENKHSSKEKQMSIGRKKFNMDPKKGKIYAFATQSGSLIWFRCCFCRQSSLLFLVNLSQRSKEARGRKRRKVVERFMLSSLKRHSSLVNNKSFLFCYTFIRQVSNIFMRIICWKPTSRMWRSFSTKAKDSIKQRLVSEGFASSCNNFIRFSTLHQAIIWARKSHSTRKCWKLLSSFMTSQILSWCKL